MYNFSKKVTFESLLNCKKGTIFSTLRKCYQNLLETFPSYQRILFQDWRSYEDGVFKHPSTVGRCGFFSYNRKKLLGFVSWDPRKRPDMGIIGHNCILPEFQGKGYGKMQINEIIRILRAEKFQNIKVTTGEHEFFVPAQKMYESSGFKEKRRYKNPSNPYFNEIDYWKKLK